MATRTIRTIETDATSSQEADWQSGAAISRNSVDSTQKPAISRHEESDAQVDWPFTSRAWQAQIPAFEEQLYCTRVYRHAANRHSWSSFLDGGRSTLAISLNSSLTLGEVSQISVYALPIFARELSNADCYDFGPLHSPMVVPLGERSAYRRKEDCTIESAENIPRLLPPGRTGGQYEVSREVTHVFATSLDISITYASAPIVVVGAREHWLYLGRVPLVVSRSMRDHTDLVVVQQVKYLFEDPGIPFRVQQLQDEFDTASKRGRDVNCGRYGVHSCAALLLRYLLRLPEPIVPYSFYDRFREPKTANEHHLGTDEILKWYSLLLYQLPKARRVLLCYILYLLKTIASSGYYECTDIPTLAKIFSPAILRPPPHHFLPRPEENETNEAVLGLLIRTGNTWVCEIHATDDQEGADDVDERVHSYLNSIALARSSGLYV